MLPLHIACGFSKANIVKFLVELNISCLDSYDSKKKHSLRHAFNGRNCDMVKCFLRRRVPLVLERSGDNDLPIHLLCKSGKDNVDHKSAEYVATIWCLILAYSEAVSNFD